MGGTTPRPREGPCFLSVQRKPRKSTVPSEHGIYMYIHPCLLEAFVDLKQIKVQYQLTDSLIYRVLVT